MSGAGAGTAGFVVAPAVGDHVDSTTREVALEHARRPPGRRDQERRTGEERAVPAAPLPDVEAVECGLSGEASAAHRVVGHTSTVEPVRGKERNRGTGEIEIVNGIPVRHIEVGHRRLQALAAAGHVVKVDEGDCERRAQSADEVAPRLVRAAIECERHDAPFGAMLLHLPNVADRNGQIVAPSVT